MPAALAAMALAAAVLSPAVGASSSSLHPKGLFAQLQDGVVTLGWNAPTDDNDGGVADSAVSVKSDVSYQQSNQDNKQFVPPPDEGESVVPRSSPQNTESVQFQDRSTLPGLPASHPSPLGGNPRPHEHPNGFVASVLDSYSAKNFVPRSGTTQLTADGITLTWRLPSQLTACASYKRVGSTPPDFKRITRPDSLTAWVDTTSRPLYKCADQRTHSGFEIYRTSFGHVNRNGAEVLLSDSQPYLIGTVGSNDLAFTDQSHDALVGPRRHNYQIRALYGLDSNGNPDHDFGGRLSASTWIDREHDAAQ
ncbi:hypothetical protein [Candidatus Poriferisodalis sp.]|uniref:hypothetical protein n=1 Tax=Candidatus Poriferisodalis sp. TaxID=3101277 RepID=UPI003C6F5352